MQYVINNMDPSWQPAKDNMIKTTTNGTKSIDGIVNSESLLSTSQILLIAFGVITIAIVGVIIGVVIFWKCRKRCLYYNKNDQENNGGARGLLLSCPKPEIVITEPTIDDPSCRVDSCFEMYSSKPDTHVTNIPRAELEDLDENELVSPACITNNTGIYPKRHAEVQEDITDQTHTRGRKYTPSYYVKSPDDKQTSFITEELDSPQDTPALSGRTQSISSSSSLKWERPSYEYSSQSPYGFHSYGIGDNSDGIGTVTHHEEYPRSDYKINVVQATKSI